MRLNEIIEALHLEVLTGRPESDREVTRGYASDLMSDVIAHAEAGAIWVTLQVHVNVVAVAAMKEIAAVVVTQGRVPDEPTLTKAAEEGVIILSSHEPTFEVIGRLYDLGIRGM